jgi:uncharacterized membrane protein
MLIDRDDARHWKAGVFYVNPEDPAILVPKRNGGPFGLGMGRTLNMAHPVSWLVMSAPIIIAVLVALSRR